MKGYDLTLVDQVRSNCTVPITVIGGAASLDDIKSLIHRYKVIGAGAGSLFVFKGKYKAVLISYPDHDSKDIMQIFK
jgi:cyclase